MKVVVVLVIGHRAGLNRRPRLGVVHVADEEKPPLALVVLSAIRSEPIALTDATSHYATAEECHLLPGGVGFDVGDRVGALWKLQVTAAWDILRLRGSSEGDEHS